MGYLLQLTTVALALRLSIEAAPVDTTTEEMSTTLIADRMFAHFLTQLNAGNPASQQFQSFLETNCNIKQARYNLYISSLNKKVAPKIRTGNFEKAKTFMMGTWLNNIAKKCTAEIEKSHPGTTKGTVGTYNKLKVLLEKVWIDAVTEVIADQATQLFVEPCDGTECDDGPTLYEEFETMMEGMDDLSNTNMTLLFEEIKANATQSFDEMTVDSVAESAAGMVDTLFTAEEQDAIVEMVENKAEEAVSNAAKNLYNFGVSFFFGSDDPEVEAGSEDAVGET